MGNYGLKVSRDGYSALTLPTTLALVQQFSLISNINLLKIKQNGTVSLGYGGNTSITHSLSYKPMVWVFANRGGRSETVYNDIGNFTNRMYVDSTRLFIQSGMSGTNDFYYYIFYDPI